MRSESGPAWASIACSSGTNTLTSPLDGLRVPTKATITRGQKAWAWEKAMPVTSIRPQLSINRPRALTRCPASPTARVSPAEPSMAAVATSPTWKASRPSPIR